MSNPMTPAAAPTTQLLDAAGLQCPAPAGFLDAEVDDVSAGPTATPQPAKSRQAAAEPVDPQRVRAMLERRYGGGRPLHYQGMRPTATAHAPAPPVAAPPSRAAVSNAVTTFFDPTAGDAGTDALAAGDGRNAPSLGGMSRPERITLARPPLAIRALGNMSYGATTADIAAFNAGGSTDAARMAAWVDRQLAWESIDDSALESRLASAGYTTLGKSLQQLWTDHVLDDPDWEVRMRPAWEVQHAALVRAVHSKRQLRELLVTFWHDHFNVMATDYSAGPVYVHYDRDVIRANAFGNFRAMLEAVAQSTAMLYFLDN